MEHSFRCINSVHGNSEKSGGKVVLLCKYKEISRHIEFEILNNFDDIFILGMNNCFN
jgi:hypothetical protein